MQARILEQSEEKLWEEFLQKHPLATIHQTPAWGRFQAKIPARGKYWIVVLEEENQSASATLSTTNPKNLPSPPSTSSPSPDASSNSSIIAGTLLIRHQLPYGHCWLYAARGPLLNYTSNDPKLPEQQMTILMEEISKIAKEENAIFLRIDPPIPAETPIYFSNFKVTKSGFQPEHTLIIDLTKTEEEILNQMKQKGRYNIRLAEKSGVTIFKSTDQSKDIATFYSLLQQTTARDKFSGHDQTFYQNMLETFANNTSTSTAQTVTQTTNVPTATTADASANAALYLAKYNEQILAAVIVTYFKDTATYYYGASSNEFRNLMAPYLLHWQIMKEAKAQGYKYYDLFGIAPENAINHPWKGVTEFKRKFGGQEVSYQKAQEISFQKAKHLLYHLYKKLR